MNLYHISSFKSMWLNTVHSILFPICPVAMYLNLIGKLLNNADTTAKFENIG